MKYLLLIILSQNALAGDNMESRNYSENVKICDKISEELTKRFPKDIKIAAMDYFFTQCIRDARINSKNSKVVR